MMSTKTFSAGLILITCIFFRFASVNAQEDVINLYQEPDTSDYLPAYYDNYLDFNLMIAASKGYDTEIKRLLAKGADPTAETSEGATALIFAVANNRVSSVKILLESNSDVNKITSAQETPLIIAVKNDNQEVAEILIRANADIGMSDGYGATPLHYSSIHGNFDLTDMLLYYEADPDKKTSDGTTPLMASIWAGFADIADLLIQNGANMESRDKEGFTPFLIASQNGDTLLMNLLIREGVDLYEKNNADYNALDLAIGSNNKPAVELLLDSGSKWFSSGMEGVNPYYVASAFGRKEIYDLLEMKNIPGKPKRRIDEIAVNANSRVNFRDYFVGLSVLAKEPLLNGGIIVGLDIKPWYTRLLMKTGDNTYYQYMDRSSMVYGGLFKDFIINANLSGKKIIFSASLVAAYPFGDKLKGTNLTPDTKLKIVPSVSLKFEKKNFQISGGIEIMRSPFYHIGPLWFRAGFSYNLYLSKVRATGKMIKWY